MKITSPALWFAVVGFSASAAWATVNSVTVTAEVDCTGLDGVDCEKKAKREARRAAIEQGAGVLVSSNSIMRNFQLVADEIATSAKGVITDEQWGPLEPGKTANTKQIKLSAKVSPEVVADSICTVIKANHDPKVSLVFVEKYGDEEKWSTERGLVEAIFSNAFAEACFTIVESGVKVTEVSATGDLPQATINEIVKNSDAQYVVLGSGKFLKQKNAGGLLGDTAMNSYSMSASLKLINTATNEIEAVSSKQLQIMGISPEAALKANDGKVNKNLTGAIMDELLKKVAQRWTGDMVNASRVSVIVQNVPSYSAAKAFKELVEKALAGSKVEQRKVAGGSASFDVNVDGGAEALAAAIEGKKAGKLSVEVIEVTRGKVILKLN